MLVVTEHCRAPAPVIRPTSSCWGETALPWPSTPAPGGTGLSSLSGSSWCPAAWRAWPWWWPAWWPHTSYCYCLWSRAAEYRCRPDVHSSLVTLVRTSPDCGHWGHWHQSGEDSSRGQASHWSSSHSDGLQLVHATTSLEAKDVLSHQWKHKTSDSILTLE